MTRGMLHRIEQDLGPVWPVRGWSVTDWALFDHWRALWAQLTDGNGRRP